ncbi:hypothetical protein NLG97_g7735 [Lecanicillium saksenae]|uniref:Uncharacterized protein n=1 Tax=Lecanicillium saksenae TaxID=468837 RepID=A0ACC1QMM2_9HYPO|nr:hypothetical protein NLG97_g7735 [Lecanicillium saksenae]
MTTENKYPPLYKAYLDDVCGVSIADRTQLCLGLFMKLYSSPAYFTIYSEVLEAMKIFQRWVRRMGILVRSPKDGRASTMFCAPTDGSACWEQKVQKSGDIDTLLEIHKDLDHIIDHLGECLWWHLSPAEVTERRFVHSMFVSPASPRNIWPTRQQLDEDSRDQRIVLNKHFYATGVVAHLLEMHNKLSPMMDGKWWDDWEKELEAYSNGERMWCAKRSDVGTMRRKSL